LPLDAGDIFFPLSRCGW